MTSLAAPQIEHEVIPERKDLPPQKPSRKIHLVKKKDLTWCGLEIKLTPVSWRKFSETPCTECIAAKLKNGQNPASN